MQVYSDTLIISKTHEQKKSDTLIEYKSIEVSENNIIRSPT